MAQNPYDEDQIDLSGIDPDLLDQLNQRRQALNLAAVQAQTGAIPQMSPEAKAAYDKVQGMQLPYLPKGVTYAGVQQAAQQNPEYQAQKQLLEQQKQMLQSQLARPQQTDLTPLAALVDSWTGSNLSKGITKPEDRAAIIDKLQQEVQKGQSGLTEEQRKYMKDVLGLGAARGQAAQDRLLLGAGNYIHNDPIIKANTQSLQSMSNSMNQIAHPPNGILTNQDFREAQMQFARALRGAGQMSDNAQEKTAYESSANKLEEMIQKITGNPRDIADSALVKQLYAQMKQMYAHIQNNTADRAQAKAANMHFMNDTANSVLQGAVSQYKRAPEEPASPSANEEVQVKNPQGQVGTIPKSQLNDALKQGYSLVK